VSLRVESDPPGADVIGPQGSSLGHTPLTTNLPRSGDPITLTISKTGFAPSRHTFTPDRDVAALVNLRATPTTRGGRPAKQEVRSISSAAGSAASAPTPAGAPTAVAPAPGPEASGPAAAAAPAAAKPIPIEAAAPNPFVEPAAPARPPAPPAGTLAPPPVSAPQNDTPSARGAPATAPN
jgi:hypothetical protein